MRVGRSQTYKKRTNNRPDHLDIRGIGSFAAVAAIAAIGLTFLIVFIFSNSSPKTNKNDDKKSNTTENQTVNDISNQPAAIRIPDNFTAYVDKDYKFSFTYPTPWGAITKATTSDPSITSLVQSLVFTHYAIGSSALDGQLTAATFKKDKFKIPSHYNGAVIAPVKLGDTYGWKVVEAGSADPTVKVGDSFNIKSTTYQSNVRIYDISIKDATYIQSRWMFESGDYFIMISMPAMSGPNATLPSAADLALYNAIGNNIAKTMRPTN